MKSYLLLGFLIVFIRLNSFAGLISVGENRDFQSIKPAVELAKDGDTIMVYGGIYREGNILIKKQIHFLGFDWPVLDGDRKYEVLSIRANNVHVEGFKVQHSGFASLDDPGGIKVYESSGVVITGNWLYENFFGVYLQYCKNCVVKNNRIFATGKLEQEIGNGVHCWKSDSLQIIGNQIFGHRDGIYFEFVSHSVIWRNISADNVRYGLHFMFSNNDAYFTNVFRNNGAGVAVMFTRNVVMMNNTFEENWGDAAYGLLLKEISDCHLSGNRFMNNTAAIFMDGNNRMRVEKNVFVSNGWGMKIQANCMDNVIEHNNFIANTFDVSTNGSLTLNTFNENYWDRYDGYDLNKDKIGDVPYRPLSLYSVIVETNPPSMLLYRSFMVTLLDKSEKVIPTLTPENFIDLRPLMYSIPL